MLISLLSLIIIITVANIIITVAFVGIVASVMNYYHNMYK